VVLEGDGSFRYVPAPGSVATPDHFQYTVQDAEGGAAIGDVAIQLFERVWYVRNDTPTAGADGTSADPFDTLVEAETAAATGDTIFIFAGTGDTTGQDAGITLQADQRLVGEAVGLSVDVALNGDPAPATLLPAGARPQITNGAAASDGVTVANVTGVEIRGLDISGTDDAIGIASSGGSDAGVAVEENVISSAGAHGIRMAAAGTGTLSATIADNDITSDGDALRAFDSGGDPCKVNADCSASETCDLVSEVCVGDGGLALAISGNTLTSTAGAGAHLDGRGLSLLVVSDFAGNAVIDTPGGTGGLLVHEGTFDAGGGAQVAGGATAVGQGTTQRVVGDGVRLINPSGDLGFASLSIFNDGGTGLQVDTKSGGTTFNLSVAGGAIDSVGGPALLLDPLGSQVNLASVTSTDSPQEGLLLDTMASGSMVTIGSTSVTRSAATAVLVRQSPTVTIDFGATTVTDSGADAIELMSNAGASISFSPLSSLTTIAGDGLVANDSGTVNIGGTGSIAAVGGAALDVTSTGAGGGWTFSGLSSSNSPTNGINLDGVTGDVTASGGAISNATGMAVRINGGADDVTYDGSVANASQKAINVTNRTGGTVSFGGAVVDTGTGIVLTNNTGSTINFSGGLDLDPTSGSMGFDAMGGGTVNVTSTNTVDATSSTAIRIFGTAIGASGVTFQRVSANEGTNGIVLNGTGMAGAFTVAGAGTADSGGTIQNATGSAIVLMNAHNVSLTEMRIADVGGDGDGIQMTSAGNVILDSVTIDDTSRHGIKGSNVNGFILRNGSEVLNAGDNPGVGMEHGLAFDNLHGTAEISDTTIAGSLERNALIANTTGSLTLTVSNTTFRDNSALLGADGLEVGVSGSGTATVNVTNSSFLRNRTNGIQTIAEGSANLDINVSGCTFEDNGVHLELSTGIITSLPTSLQTGIGVMGNSMLRAVGPAVLTTGNGGTVDATVINNTIGTSGVPDSGSLVDRGILVRQNENGLTRALVDGNTVRGTDQEGILANSRRPVVAFSAGDLQVALTNNVVEAPDDNGLFPFFNVSGMRAVAQQENTLCLDIAGNSSAPAAGGFGFGYRLRQRDASVFQLERFTGDGTNPAQIEAFVVGQNISGTAGNTTIGIGYQGVADGTCQPPM
jgi:hypothetical protein